MQVRHFVLTGAPGSGKTTIAGALRDRGHSVIAEAATDLITAAQAAGIDEPWRDPAFVTDVLACQRQRRDEGSGPVRFHDRGPLCTVALARYAGLPEPDTDGLGDTAFLVRPLGFITRTAARRISYPDALRFEAIHVDVYREHGCRLVDVPPLPLADRVDLIEAYAYRGVRRR